MNIEEKVKMIQMQIEAIQTVVKKTKELSDVQDRFYEIYEKIKSSDRENIIFLQKAKDEGLNYIKKMNNLLVEINLLKKEAGKMDKKEMEMLTQYVKVYSEFNRITSKIETIENLSKKSTNHLIEVEDAEDRKKQIDETLADEYENLIAQKKELNSKYLQAYNKLMNYDVHPVKEADEKEDENNDIRLKEVKKEIKNIKVLPQNTEDGFVPEDNKKYSIFNFGKLCYLKNQKRQLEEGNNIKEGTDAENISEIIITKINQRKKHAMKQKLKKIGIVVTIGIATTVSIFGLKKGQKKLQVNVKTETNTTNNDLKPEIEIYDEEQVISTKKANDFPETIIGVGEQNQYINEKIETLTKNQEQPREKIDLDGKIMGKANSTIKKSSMEPIDVGEINEENYTLENNDNTSLQIGDSFTIEDNAEIYSNEYDADKEINGNAPVHANNKERNAIGIAYKLPSGEVVVAKNEQEAQVLQNAGGTITSYLAGYKDGTEGFYNVDNVIPTDQNLGGKSL